MFPQLFDEVKVGFWAGNVIDRQFFPLMEFVPLYVPSFIRVNHGNQVTNLPINPAEVDNQKSS